MSGLAALVAWFGVGVVLGAAFFWGLWATVQGLHQARHPAVRMLCSLLLRFALVLGGFYLVAAQGQLRYLLAAAVGFTLPRLLITARMAARRTSAETDR